MQTSRREIKAKCNNGGDADAKDEKEFTAIE